MEKRTGMSISKFARIILAVVPAVFFTACGNYTPTQPASSASHFAFVSNTVSNSISIFAVDQQTGQLSLKSTVPTGGTGSRVIAVANSGRFAYIGNGDSDNVSGFAIDP